MEAHTKLPFHSYVTLNRPASITLSGTGVKQLSHSVTLTWTASTSTVSG